MTIKRIIFFLVLIIVTAKSFAITTRYTLNKIDEKNAPTCILDIMTNGQYLLIGSQSGMYKYNGWNISQELVNKSLSKRIIFLFKDHNENIYCLDNYNKYYRISKDATINEYNLKNYELISPNGRYIVSIQSIFNKYKSFWDIPASFIDSVYGKMIIARCTNRFEAYSNDNIFKMVNITEFDHTRLFIQNKKLFYLSQNGSLYQFDSNFNSRRIANIPIKQKDKSTIHRSGEHVYITYNNDLISISVNKENVLIDTLATDSIIIPNVRTIVNYRGAAIVGTYSNGLYKLVPKYFNTTSFILPISYSGFIPVNDSNQVLSFADNKLYDGKLLPISHTHTHVKKISAAYVCGNNNFLISSLEKNNSLLYCYANGIWDKIVAIQERINNIIIDSNNTIWITTDKSIGYINKQKYTRISDKIDSLVTITNIKVIDKNSIYISALNGLYILDTRSKKISSIPAFHNIEVRYIKKTDSIIWVTTYGNGLYAITSKRVIHFPYDMYNRIQFCQTIIEDSIGRFWFPTNHGLIISSKSALLQYINTSEKPGYYYIDEIDINREVTEFSCTSNPQYARDKYGYYYLPTTTRLVRFNPEKVPTDYPNYSISLLYIRVNGNKTFLNIPEKLSSNSHSITLILDLPYNGSEKNIDLQYSITKDNEEDSTWQSVQSNEIKLPLLTTGNYRITIRLRNGFMPNNFIYKTISFFVKPKYYQTTEFRLAITLTFLLLIVLGFTIRTRVLRLRNIRLSIKIQEATQQLTEINNKLNRNIAFKNKLISIFSHDILGSIHFLNRSIKALFNNNNNAKEIIEAVDKLELYGEDLILWVKLQNKNYDYIREYSTFQLSELISEKWQILSQVSSSKNVSLNVNNKNKIIKSDRRIIGIMLYNILSNAAKYSSPNSVINVNVKSLNNYFTVEISNTGSNIPVDIIKDLSMEQFTYTTDSIDRNPRGVGLYIVKMLLEQVNGTISFSNHKDGVTVSITLPTY